jgi:hypothetical protein
MKCPICRKNRLAFHVGNGKVQGITEMPDNPPLFRRFKPCMQYRPGTPIFEALVTCYEIISRHQQQKESISRQFQQSLQIEKQRFVKEFTAQLDTIEKLLASGMADK